MEGPRSPGHSPGGPVSACQGQLCTAWPSARGGACGEAAATCFAWTGTLALAMWPELPLRVPERTAGGRCVTWLPSRHGSGGARPTPHAWGRGRGDPHPLTPLHPAEQRPHPSGGHHRATRTVQLGPVLRQKRLKAHRDQVGPAPSSRTRSGVWGRRKKNQTGARQAVPGPDGRPPHSFGY